ncbi:MAG: hypothetical protein G01um101425_860 [Candidatus Peregrinibacteria bacterium Gr01-1014_25]|nr:MAG: hypothetical protein G01um101425_860 [Candidatus Peregrinibacteria bacterium Gr01-1014_25]
MRYFSFTLSAEQRRLWRGRMNQPQFCPPEMQPNADRQAMTPEQVRALDERMTSLVARRDKVVGRMKALRDANVDASHPAKQLMDKQKQHWAEQYDKFKNGCDQLADQYNRQGADYHAVLNELDRVLPMWEQHVEQTAGEQTKERADAVRPEIVEQLGRLRAKHRNAANLITSAIAGMKESRRYIPKGTTEVDNEFLALQRERRDMENKYGEALLNEILRGTQNEKDYDGDYLEHQGLTYTYELKYKSFLDDATLGEERQNEQGKIIQKKSPESNGWREVTPQGLGTQELGPADLIKDSWSYLGQAPIANRRGEEAVPAKPKPTEEPTKTTESPEQAMVKKLDAAAIGTRVEADGPNGKIAYQKTEQGWRIRFGSGELNETGYPISSRDIANQNPKFVSGEIKPEEKKTAPDVLRNDPSKARMGDVWDKPHPHLRNDRLRFQKVGTNRWEKKIGDHTTALETKTDAQMAQEGFAPTVDRLAKKQHPVEKAVKIGEWQSKMPGMLTLPKGATVEPGSLFLQHEANIYVAKDGYILKSVAYADAASAKGKPPLEITTPEERRPLYQAAFDRMPQNVRITGQENKELGAVFGEKATYYRTAENFYAMIKTNDGEEVWRRFDWSKGDWDTNTKHLPPDQQAHSSDM